MNLGCLPAMLGVFSFGVVIFLFFADRVKWWYRLVTAFIWFVFCLILVSIDPILWTTDISGNWAKYVLAILIILIMGFMLREIRGDFHRKKKIYRR